MGVVIANRLPNDSNLKKDLKDNFFETVRLGRIGEGRRTTPSEKLPRQDQQDATDPGDVKAGQGEKARDV